ncbi:uncharacterized protein LOC120270435 [Dioscorea cayenensis subsp. rotundata]|uniref:Uncharacterized protein LOC120270435 n=1 Tax=Dioscorea cayennensis subsp. rotundata TaxID=55577 RepID=A0AB40C0S7_DIOCR|nr:uncharacterized protein LOC120270435 [Dioscorea cayenensis subsp. rotundata]
MPPSPALRCSPGRELRTEHNHKRGRSFESSVPMKTKDDDLTLFTDMESRERDNFLLQSADDLNASIARLRYCSDLKLSVNIRAGGQSSELLNVDGEKNDYDWLLTPPDTPLFRSLDDEEAQPVNPAPRGRQHSQPISIRSPASEKAQRTSRSSYSPHRLSPSPRSTTGVTQPKVTPSSAPHSSLTPLRPTTPSRRPSTPPNKPSATTPRSSTPTLRRMSTGSGGQASSPVRRGTSPVRPSRGNSASPKLRGWLTNPPGFSSDSPANLCTSLAELPSSNSKAVSPASRNGRQSMSPTAPRNRRLSMSPVGSRSTTALHSHERDRFSTYSKGSVASSGDDDVDSLYSVGIETSSSPSSGQNGVIGNSRAIPFSKKPVRTPSASSIPKRSYDSALRQVDHHKTPQNMFRPLLSSVPTTTFYTGKANSVHRPLFSRNSSVTTSSNASSELGVIVAHDFVEAEDHDQNHLVNEWEKPQDFDAQEEIFIFDKMDEISENGHSVGGVSNKVDLEEEKSAANFRDPGCIAPASDASYLAGIPSKVDCLEMLKTCSKCGKQFRIMDMESITDVCQECVDDDLASSEAASQTAFLVAQNEYSQSVRHAGIDRLSEEMLPAMEISELPGLHENNVDRDPDFVPSSSFCNMEVDLTKVHSDQQPKSYQEEKAVQSESKFQEPRDVTHPSPRASTPEGTGISVLLQRSSSSKWPVVQGRAFLASSIMCSEPSYTRDNANVLRRSFSRDSASPSSSVDLASSRQSEFRLQRQLSSRKAEIEHMRNAGNAKAQITEPLNSGVSSEQTLNGFVDAVDYEPYGKKETFDHEHNNSLENMRSSSTKSMPSTQAVVEGDLFGCTDSFTVVDSLHDVETGLAGVSEKLGNNRSTRESGVEHGIPDSSCIGEEDMLNNSVCGNEMSAVPTESPSLAMPQLQISLEGVQDLQSDSAASSDRNNMDVSPECSGPASLEKDSDSPASAMESYSIDQHHEKSMITVEGPRGHMSRSLTLEEVTDTILFCSSIIHDLAYKAATEVMEREEFVTEPLRPTIPSNRNTVANPKGLIMDIILQTNTETSKDQAEKAGN